MKEKSNRREFIKMAALSGVNLGLANSFPTVYANKLQPVGRLGSVGSDKSPSLIFTPNRSASWWCTIEDLQWSQKKIVDKIKRRAEGFAEAKIDTAINFGFHIRFDFSNYFGQLHGYYNNVCEELHKYDIKFMDHYSCNHVERPRGEVEFKKLQRGQRHHVLLFHDPVAAQYAQYEGYLFNNICEVDLRDGNRGYSKQYQMETFCHNNPGFLDMHKKYLIRLMNEVPFDGIEVDDMCNYAGLTTCGCKYCRERLNRNYGHEIPAFGDKPLMSCCSSTGPIALNAISLDLEKMAPYLDFFMLENVGTNIRSVNWIKMEMETVISSSNHWEVKNSDLNYRDGRDLVEVRLVNSSYCRENGWHDKEGLEHWERVKAWSAQFVKNNVGYRFLRSGELADEVALNEENTPLILDGLGCVSDKQLKAIENYLSKDGIAWLALPFGTHDEKGFKRRAPLSEDLMKGKFKNLVIVDSAASSNPLHTLISEGRFKPVLKQVKGDAGWAAHKFEINTNRLALPKLSIMSPEFGEEQRPVDIQNTKNGYSTIQVNLDGVKAYAVVQKAK